MMAEIEEEKKMEIKLKPRKVASPIRTGVFLKPAKCSLCQELFHLETMEMCRGCIWNDGISCNNDPAPNENGRCLNYKKQEP